MKCPTCGKEYHAERTESSAAGVELGYSKTIAPHKGVHTVCSFTWAMKPSQLLDKNLVIEDEYGHNLSTSMFAQMLHNMCPIEFYYSIGQEFS